MTVGVSKGGVPAPTTAADLLELDDGQLGAALVAVLSAKDPRHSNFAALGRLVRSAVALVYERRGVGVDGVSILEEVLRRPGKARKP